MIYKNIDENIGIYYKDIIINLEEIYKILWGNILHLNQLKSKKKRLKRIKHFK